MLLASLTRQYQPSLASLGGRMRDMRIKYLVINLVFIIQYFKLNIKYIIISTRTIRVLNIIYNNF
jgi:hypothetical protein